MGVRHMQGTPAHIETLHAKDKRRHRSKCEYYVSDTGRCSFLAFKCDGSAHCNYYAENNEPTSLTFTKKIINLLQSAREAGLPTKVKVKVLLKI